MEVQIMEQCYASEAYAVMRCLSLCLCIGLSVTIVNSVEKNKHIFKTLSPSGSHTILVFHTKRHGIFRREPLPPNGGVEWRWDRQKLRFWVNIWLYRMLWTLRPPGEIHSAATDHGELMTLVAAEAADFVDGGRRRQTVWQEASTLSRRQQSSISLYA